MRCFVSPDAASEGRPGVLSAAARMHATRSCSPLACARACTARAAKVACHTRAPSGWPCPRINARRARFPVCGLPGAPRSPAACACAAARARNAAVPLAAQGAVCSLAKLRAEPRCWTARSRARLTLAVTAGRRPGGDRRRLQNGCDCVADTAALAGCPAAPHTCAAALMCAARVSCAAPAWSSSACAARRAFAARRCSDTQALAARGHAQTSWRGTLAHRACTLHGGVRSGAWRHRCLLRLHPLFSADVPSAHRHLHAATCRRPAAALHAAGAPAHRRWRARRVPHPQGAESASAAVPSCRALRAVAPQRRALPLA
jgi:hypothetical protein